MSHLDPIAYTFDADVHCPTCTESRFGRSARGFIAEDSTDSEGNNVGAIFSHDDTTGEDGRGYFCGKCHERISDDWCVVCNDYGEHIADDHELLVMRDTGHRSIEDMTATILSDVVAILTEPFPNDVGAVVADSMRRSATDIVSEYDVAERDEYGYRDLEAQIDMCDDAEELLHNAGYIVVSDSDAASWSVYAPVAGYRATCGSIRPHGAHTLSHPVSVDGPTGRMTTTFCVGNIGAPITEVTA